MRKVLGKERSGGPNAEFLLYVLSLLNASARNILTHCTELVREGAFFESGVSGEDQTCLPQNSSCAFPSILLCIGCSYHYYKLLHHTIDATSRGCQLVNIERVRCYISFRSSRRQSTVYALLASLFSVPKFRHHHEISELGCALVP